MNLLVQLIEHLTNIIVMIFMTRILLQLAQVDFNNPIAQFIHKFTLPLINPLRRFIPDLGKFNLSALVICLALVVAKLFLFSLIFKQPLGIDFYLVVGLIGFPKIGIAGLFMIFLTLLTILFIGLMLVGFIAGGQYHPGLSFLHQITRPLLKPLQKFIPPLGGTIDITPMILLLVLFYMQNALLNFVATLFVAGS